MADLYAWYSGNLSLLESPHESQDFSSIEKKEGPMCGISARNLLFLEILTASDK